MNEENYNSEVVEQLKVLNNKFDRQNSLRRVLITGIVYGVGFFVGSAVLATIALGILGPIVGEIEWVQSSFDTGTDIILGR